MRQLRKIFLDGPPSPGRLIVGMALFYALMHGCIALYEQTVQYFAFDDRVGFLPIKRPILELGHWKLAFYVHVFSSIFLLFAAFTQFIPIKHRGIAKIHRFSGRSYVYILLILSAPSGLLMAFYAEGGWIGKAGFITLACLWWGTTAMGLNLILRRKIREHSEWMARSYALTFSAVTLREWQYWFAVLLPPTWNTVALVAWLGWTLNLGLVELWIRRHRLLAASSSPGISPKSSAVPQTQGID